MRGFGNYDKYPFLEVEGKAYSGYEEILNAVNPDVNGNKVVVFDCYPVVDVESIVSAIGDKFDNIVRSDDCAYKNEDLTEKMQRFLTDDRIFGLMTTDYLQDFFIEEKLEEARCEVRECKGTVLVIGVGAMLVTKGDINVHCSLARWESQMRFRKGEPNWNCDNYDMDPLTKFKRGYFVEWRLGDKHKVAFHNDFDFFIDTNIKETPKMVSRADYDNAIAKAVTRPFRLVPYFDPGVWGGQWMKDVCGLDRSKDNFAWCFDCVPEENSIQYKFGDVIMEMPSIDIVLHEGRKLLGDRVQGRFGNEFPIRFDFLDTIGGHNLSLQVHPTTEYIQEHFNMRYTQDESYYILDTEGDNVGVFLGVKKGINPDEFIGALNEAQETGEFDAEKFVNFVPAKKHDHFLIPAGTVHCSGSGAMVLEISSTPYIFTFKLWDWGRLGLDGKPRPINIKHGNRVIDYTRDLDWVTDHLVNDVTLLEKNENVTIEKTGLHEREPLETVRHSFTAPVTHNTKGSVNVLNLVEGSEAVVTSPTDSFEPFVVHYAETFVVPANVGDYIIAPTEKSKGEELKTLKAYVR